MRRGKKGIMETGGENVILREVRLVDRRRECCKRSGKTGRQEERMILWCTEYWGRVQTGPAHRDKKPG